MSLVTARFINAHRWVSLGGGKEGGGRPSHTSVGAHSSWGHLHTSLPAAGTFQMNEAQGWVLEALQSHRCCRCPWGVWRHWASPPLSAELVAGLGAHWRVLFPPGSCKGHTRSPCTVTCICAKAALGPR